MLQNICNSRRGELCESASPKRNGWGHVLGFHIAQHRGLNAAEREVKVGALGNRTAILAVAVFELRRRKIDCRSVAVLRHGIDDGPAGVAKRKQFSHFVESFSGGVVAGVSDVLVAPNGINLLGEVEVSVPA